MTALLGRVLCWFGFHAWEPWKQVSSLFEMRICRRMLWNGCESQARWKEPRFR